MQIYYRASLWTSDGHSDSFSVPKGEPATNRVKPDYEIQCQRRGCQQGQVAA